MPHVGAPSASPVELLVPAGSRDALVAAVRNGADAVYLGVESLNARRGADNFALEDLAEVCDFAHLRDTRVHLTANVLVLPEEVQEALTLVDRAWEAGVDAVIIQDLGLMRLVHEALPDVRIHASTQIGAHNADTIALLADMGCERVTLARELSIREISSLATTGAVEIETFVHGALCVCYSGQCLLGSMVGGRSANRGMCAQPCRLPYTLIGDDGEAIEADGPFLLSPKDLAGIARLPELIEAGVGALKIEGRMKSPEYVALVTGVYRRALDRAVESPHDFSVSDGEWSVLEEAFSRGFTDAYLDGLSDERLMSPRRPNDRGVRLGRVTSAGPGEAIVKLERALDPEDRVEFWTSKGRFAQVAGALTVDGRSVTTAPAGVQVRIATERRASGGDRVFRVADAKLLAAARRTYSGPEESRATPVEFTVDVTVGEPLALEAATSLTSVRVEGPIVEAARTKTISAEEIIEHVGRLGGTSYDAASWDVRLDPTAGLSYGALHAVRREALEAIDKERLAASRSRERRSPSVPELKRPADRGHPILVAVVASVGVAASCREAGADLLLVEHAPASDAGVSDGVQPLLGRIARDDEVWEMLELAHRWGGATVGNIGALRRLHSEALPLDADWPTNATNVHAVSALAAAGAERVWLSPELTLEQVSEIAARSPVPVGVAVLGRQELMVTEHCFLETAGRCDRRCADCARRARRWGIEDRKGYRLPVRTDTAGRSHIYNAVPLDATHAMPELLAAGVSAFRLDLSLEPAQNAARLTAAARERLMTAVAGNAVEGGRLLEPSTTGHFFRGVE